MFKRWLNVTAVGTYLLLKFILRDIYGLFLIL